MQRGDGNSGHVGLVDFLSDKDTRFLHSHGNEGRRQKILCMHKNATIIWGINIQVRCHYCICKILFLAHEEILSHTAPSCEGDFFLTTNHQKTRLFAAGFFLKTCPTPQIQLWGSGRKGIILQKNEQKQNQQKYGTAP